MAAQFGLMFVGHTPPIVPPNGIVQVDPTHWVMDVATVAGPAWGSLKEVALFLMMPGVLPPDAALALYVSSSGGSAWSYRGMVSNAHPSEVMPLSLPEPEGGTAVAPQIGVSLEPLAEAAAKSGLKLAAKQEFAKRVGQDLFNYLASYGMAAGADRLLLQWFERLTKKLDRDPDFLARQELGI